MRSLALNNSSDTDARSLRAEEARPRILVAEDHDDTRLMLRLFLEAHGFEVVEVSDGEEAARALERALPDLILLDAELPRIDGVALTRSIRASYPSERVPIIFLSGRAEPRAQMAAFDAGCDDYLTKPLALDRLNAVLRHYLGGAPPRRRPILIKGELPT